MLTDKYRQSPYRWMLLGLLQFLVITAVILPDIDKIDYYQNKTDHIKKEQAASEKFSHHMSTHSQNIDRVRQELTAYQRVFSANMQQHLGKLLRKHDLNLSTIQSSQGQQMDSFPQTIVTQTIDGKYHDLEQYLERLTTEKAPLILSSAHFMNLEPTQEDPSIRAELEIHYFSTPKESQ